MKEETEALQGQKARKDRDTYADIIGCGRPLIPGHPRMPLTERAAQFGAFAALTGHADAVRETARSYNAREEFERDETGEVPPDWDRCL